MLDLPLPHMVVGGMGEAKAIMFLTGTQMVQEDSSHVPKQGWTRGPTLLGEDQPGGSFMACYYMRGNALREGIGSKVEQV